jgi:CheY-like chemotaxis protein
VTEADTGATTPVILVVDDEWLNRELMDSILTSGGFRVLQARSGEKALEMIANGQPDLVLLDVRMPGMDGYEVCRTIKAGSAALPVIMVTGMEGDAERQAALVAGADDFLSRLAPPQQVIEQVQRLLSAHLNE